MRLFKEGTRVRLLKFNSNDITTTLVRMVEDGTATGRIMTDQQVANRYVVVIFDTNVEGHGGSAFGYGPVPGDDWEHRCWGVPAEYLQIVDHSNTGEEDDV